VTFSDFDVRIHHRGGSTYPCRVEARDSQEAATMALEEIAVNRGLNPDELSVVMVRQLASVASRR
jgi:hypothetical protein